LPLNLAILMYRAFSRSSVNKLTMPVICHNDNRDDGGVLRLSVDTHGYTNVGMAVSKLLGFDLCPRLRNLSERKLHLPRGVAAPERLAAVVAYEISIKAIRDGFERSRGSRVSGAVFA
jgi:hypothetical protein